MTRLIEATANQWNKSHGTYIAGQAYIDGADYVAAQMEATWGVDRLRLLVDPELREKFDRQRYLYSAAITGGTLEHVRRESQRMIAAYTKLNEAAQAAGAKHLNPEIWEVALANGMVAAIVRDNHDAHMMADQFAGRRTAVYTLEEVGRILSLYGSVADIKESFPGAEVTATRKSIGDPLRGVDAIDFDEPLNDLFNGGRD